MFSVEQNTQAPKLIHPTFTVDHKLKEEQFSTIGNRNFQLKACNYVQVLRCAAKRREALQKYSFYEHNKEVR